MKKIIVLLTILVFSRISNAAILAEPYLGFNITGKSNQQTYTNSSGSYTYSNKYRGPHLGARLGYDVLGIMGGLSFDHSFYTLKEENAGVSSETDSQRNDIGIFFGYNAPLLFKVWMGYSFSAKETESDNGNYKKGSAVELGFGYTVIPLLCINLQIKTITFTTDHSVNSGTDTTFSPSLNTSEIVLSVGAPFSFF